MRNRLFAYAKTKTQISFAVTAKLISTFVFATRIKQSLYFLNPKFQASSHLLWLYSLVCVGPGRKPRRPVFSERGSFLSKTNRSKLHRRVIFTWPFTESEQAELILILANSYLGETHNRHLLFLSRRFPVKITRISLTEQLQLIWMKYKLHCIRS